MKMGWQSIRKQLYTESYKRSSVTPSSTVIVEFAIDIDYQDENLNLRIEFDGTIFDFEDEMKNSEGLGLRNIESRVRYLNGNLKYHNTDIRNFYIISVPKDAKY